MQQWIQIYTITTQIKSKIALLKPLFMVEWSNSMQLKKQTWHDTRRTICQVYLWPLFGNTWQQSGVKIMTNHTQKWRVVWWRCVLSPILFNWCITVFAYTTITCLAPFQMPLTHAMIALGWLLLVSACCVTVPSSRSDRRMCLCLNGEPQIFVFGYHRDLGRVCTIRDLGRICCTIKDPGRVCCTIRDPGRVCTIRDLSRVCCTIRDLGRVCCTIRDLGRVVNISLYISGSRHRWNEF